MTEQSGQPRGPRTGVYPGTFDPIHMIRRTTLFDVAEDEHVVAVARPIGAAEPNEPEQDGPGGHAFSGSGPNEPAAAVQTTVPEDMHSAAAVQTNPRAVTAAALSARGRASGELGHD
jgi:hypothetical protein